MVVRLVNIEIKYFRICIYPRNENKQKKLLIYSKPHNTIFQKQKRKNKMNSRKHIQRGKYL